MSLRGGVSSVGVIDVREGGAEVGTGVRAVTAGAASSDPATAVPATPATIKTAAADEVRKDWVFMRFFPLNQCIPS
jgi:hypothetical protein